MVDFRDENDILFMLLFWASSTTIFKEFFLNISQFDSVSSYRSKGLK